MRSTEIESISRDLDSALTKADRAGCKLLAYLISVALLEVSEIAQLPPAMDVKEAKSI